MKKPLRAGRLKPRSPSPRRSNSRITPVNRDLAGWCVVGAVVAGWLTEQRRYGRLLRGLSSSGEAGRLVGLTTTDAPEVVRPTPEHGYLWSLAGRRGSCCDSFCQV